MLVFIMNLRGSRGTTGESEQSWKGAATYVWKLIGSTVAVPFVQNRIGKKRSTAKKFRC